MNPSNECCNAAIHRLAVSHAPHCRPCYCAPPTFHAPTLSLLAGDSELADHLHATFECAQCHAALPTARLLELHVAELHDSFFAAQAARRMPVRHSWFHPCLLACCCGELHVAEYHDSVFAAQAAGRMPARLRLAAALLAIVVCLQFAGKGLVLLTSSLRRLMPRAAPAVPLLFRFSAFLLSSVGPPPSSPPRCTSAWWRAAPASSAPQRSASRWVALCTLVAPSINLKHASCSCSTLLTTTSPPLVR